jgi:hypothetical protein
VAGGGHQHLVVVERDHRQHHVLGQRVRERMKLSLQQVHSRPCTQITGVRGLVSSAWAICGTKAGARPSDAAVRLQNLRSCGADALPAHHFVERLGHGCLLDMGCSGFRHTA